MPQKRNPVVAELIRAKASTVYGDLIASLSILKALPYSYNIDLQELTLHLFNACAIALESTMILANMLREVSFNKNRMKNILKGDMSNATELADFLVTRYHLPFRTAHRIVGILARESVEAGASFDSYVKDRLLDVVKYVTGRSIMLEEELDKILDPEHIVETSNVVGGPSPSIVRVAIQSARKRLEEDRCWIDDVRRRLMASDAILEDYVKKVQESEM